MDAESYRNALLAVLRAHSGQALETLRALDAVLPQKTRAVEIGIHPSQEADGMFSVLVHLEGPDLYALNKAIATCRTLFDVRYEQDGRLEPEVPLFNPLDPPFAVNDVIADTAFVWLEELWKAFGGTTSRLPAMAFGEEGYGTTGPKHLSP